MWNVIGGFVVSSIAEVVVKEIVKEIRKPGRPSAPQQEAPAKHLRHTKGQVMILDWMPAHEDASPPQDKAAKVRQRAVGRRKSPRRPTSSQRHG
ncbi:MAG TPA: hypothetical protein VFG09_04965 [Thermodesulfovibrionales bacterium]|jgi:hypothetical protein|nr:hypothetical protein [Thermodesulfovibrionales bacterium]